MATVEVELPHVFPHGIAPNTTPCTKADMVIDLAAIDERAFPFVLGATILPGTRARNVLGIHMGLTCCDQVVDGKAFEEFLGVSDHRCVTRTGGTLPGRNTIVAEEGKVWLRVVSHRGRDGGTLGILGSNTIANKMPMGRDSCRQNNGIGGVPSIYIAKQSIVFHRQYVPRSGIAGIIDGDVVSGGDDLII